MTPREQQRFIKEMLGCLSKSLVAAVKDRRIPADWDGIELREYLYEITQRNRYNHLLTGERGRRYRNTIITTNL